MPTPRKEIGDRMLFAVDALNEELGTPTQNTKNFWDAFGAFGTEFLVGKFNMVVNQDTGHIVITYKPEI